MAKKTQKVSRFTDDELLILKEMTCSGISNSAIALKLNRTEKSITSKKERLLKDNPNFFSLNTKVIYRTVEESLKCLKTLTSYEYELEDIFKQNDIDNKEELDKILKFGEDDILNRKYNKTYSIFNFIS